MNHGLNCCNTSIGCFTLPNFKYELLSKRGKFKRNLVNDIRILQAANLTIELINELEEKKGEVFVNSFTNFEKDKLRKNVCEHNSFKL